MYGFTIITNNDNTYLFFKKKNLSMCQTVLSLI